MSTDVKLKITEIQRFCMHDGPGIRTTVFLKGCPLSCAWCHNPETQNSATELLLYPNKCIGCKACTDICKTGAHVFEEKPYVDRKKCLSCFDCAMVCPTGASEICGKDMSIDDILTVIEKDTAFYGNNGGVTLSGGEPFMQKYAAIEFLKACKSRGLSTAVETCGYADHDVLLASIPFVDIFLWDIKDTDSERHKSYVGVSSEKILNNLNIINEAASKIRLRCILVNQVNTDTEHYLRIADIAKRIKNFDGVEFIPYHAYGGTKATFIGKCDNGRPEWIPESSQIEEAKKLLTELSVKVL